MFAYVGSLLVEDPNGNQLQLHEYRGRRFLVPIRRYVLDTGETVTRVSGDTFVIPGTGERLLRVDED